MPTNRQDAWTQDEDILLAEVVLRHIREGGTQLKAFEEVGKKLSRTAAACGFRWNSFVRKQYQSGIELAKRQRKQLKKQLHSEKREMNESQEALSISVDQPDINEDGITFEEVIRFLNNIHLQYEKTKDQQKLIEQYEEKIKVLEKKAHSLATENERLAKELQAVEMDYRALLEIMDRARKMVSLEDESDRKQKVKFQMDKNGNLERVDK